MITLKRENHLDSFSIKKEGDPMTEIHTNFFNFSEAALLSQILPASEKFEFTADKIFRKRETPVCTCNCKCNYNGYNFIKKKHFGKIKIGKYVCPNCNNQFYEDKSFWKKIINDWNETVTNLFIILRDSHVGYRIISQIMSFLIPCGKDKIYTQFNDKMDSYIYNVNESFLIVHYDEQHPKRGRNQKFRLTLLSTNGKVIADETFNNKDKETIKRFLLVHLDASKEIVIITDCDRGYPNLFKEIWGKKVRHQKCLLHLNKLICKDFGKNTDLIDEYNKYSLLNIFYDRSNELKKLEKLMKNMELQKFETKKEKRKFIIEAKKEFWDYLKKRENRRRRKGKNLKQRILKDTEEKFAKIIFEQNYFPKKVQKRIEMIKENWEFFTNFYHVKDCPATNNKIENYYSTSLKTHRKKQFREDRGLLNQMKVAALKRNEGFSKPKETLLEILKKICLLVT